MHPGNYYLYSLYDANGDGTFSSGDWMSSNLTNTFTLGALGCGKQSGAALFQAGEAYQTCWIQELLFGHIVPWLYILMPLHECHALDFDIIILNQKCE